MEIGVKSFSTLKVFPEIYETLSFEKALSVINCSWFFLFVFGSSVLFKNPIVEMLVYDGKSLERFFIKFLSVSLRLSRSRIREFLKSTASVNVALKLNDLSLFKVFIDF